MTIGKDTRYYTVVILIRHCYFKDFGVGLLMLLRCQRHPTLSLFIHLKFLSTLSLFLFCNQVVFQVCCYLALVVVHKCDVTAV